MRFKKIDWAFAGTFVALIFATCYKIAIRDYGWATWFIILLVVGVLLKLPWNGHSRRAPLSPEEKEDLVKAAGMIDPARMSREWDEAKKMSPDERARRLQEKWDEFDRERALAERKKTN